MPASTPTTTVQLQCMKQGGPLEIVHVPYPTPKEDEVLIRQKVVAFNLVDTKQRDFAVRSSKFPCVLGLEGGGVVEAVGDGVTRFKVGDEVAGWEWEAFQERVAAKEGMLFKKPSNLTLVEAASMPDCLVTAISAIVTALHIPLPFFSSLPAEGSPPSSVLILGGASAVGANAVQLLGVAYPSLPIIATASSKHHSHITNLGASQVVDYKSSSVTADIKAASPNGIGVDIIIDCVAAGASQTDICDALDKNGSKRYSSVFTGVDMPVLEGVNKIVTLVNLALNRPRGNEIIAEITKLVEKGIYKLPLPVRVIRYGLEALVDILDEVKKASYKKPILIL
ncbi:hypothetical protein M409DRAFT_36202 [Zasmidium cellare ATCC 36951]|uniref:Enoyl reductase (ER) domain-containing protein n=1 Tax=Zasmidium cellare ATCC 36951 TaxID=1080233 RepID=A0A6A6CQZ8_ZASCE|nr:uncharacterized protein M409DRAFT_36202 [Zasmidium cellare ATCC 36951]KAF2169501.1 hypothetical protein M409DRAFT_36202 [Zasmidium cellare ATCC 36951]